MSFSFKPLMFVVVLRGIFALNRVFTISHTEKPLPAELLSDLSEDNISSMLIEGTCLGLVHASVVCSRRVRWFK